MTGVVVSSQEVLIVERLRCSSFTGLVFGCFLALLGSRASAEECAGQVFDGSVSVGNQTLVLNGLGMREATILNVDVYVAGLYLLQRTHDVDTIMASDDPYFVDMRMLRDLSAEDIVEAFVDGLNRNGGEVITRHQDELNQLVGWIDDASEGDVATYTYIPGTGLEIRFRGQLMGTIADAEFARVFLTVWLGRDPPDEDLKEGMLGGECT
jgi:hypothetical protein